MSNTLAEPAELEYPPHSDELPKHEAGQQKEVFQKRRRLARGERQDFKKKIRDLKQAQKKRIRAITKKHRNEQKLMQRKLKEQAAKSRKDLKRELARTRKNYQIQLENIRQIYFEQNTAYRNELRNSLAIQLEGIKKNYDEIMATSSQTQLEALEGWLKDEFLKEMREKTAQINKAEIEQARLNGQLQVGKLVQQLEERSLEVELLKQKVAQLERQVPQSEQQAEAQNFQMYGFEEQSDSQKQELLSVIKEIAEEQQAMQEEEGQESKQPFWGRFRKGMKQKVFPEPSEA